MDIEDIKKDSSLIEAGTWVDRIPNMGDLRLRVRGMGSKQAINHRSSLERAVDKKGRSRDGSLKLSVSMDIAIQVLLNVCLLEWDGLKQKGKPVEYSKELAALWLTDPNYRNFADAVAWAAGVVDRGSADSEEELTGNS